MKPEQRRKQLILRVKSLTNIVHNFYENFMFSNYKMEHLGKLEQIHKDIIKFLKGWIENE